MPAVSGLQFAFLAFNAGVGLLVGLLATFSTAFANLGIPVFAWLILAMFLFEVAAGFLHETHPAHAITLAVRIAAISMSLLICFATMAYFQPA